MRRHLLSLITLCALLHAPCASAGWSGFPFTNSNQWITEEQLDLYEPTEQAYRATLERMAVQGRTNKPAIYETTECFAGYSEATESFVLTNSSGGVVANTVTNITLLTTNITLLNCFTNFRYTYTDPSGTHSATGSPWFRNTGDAFDLLYSEFLSDLTAPPIKGWAHFDQAVGGTFNTFFGRVSSDFLKPRDLPYWTYASLASAAWPEAYIHSVGSNGWGVITGAAWRPPLTDAIGPWLMGEACWTNAQPWKFSDAGVGPYSIVRLTGSFPLLRWMPAGPNSFFDMTVEVTGNVLYCAADNVLSGEVEVISMDGSNTLLTKAFVDVQGITVDDAAPNGNDVIQVLWTNDLVRMYGLGLTHSGQGSDRMDRLRINWYKPIMNKLIWTIHPAASCSWWKPDSGEDSTNEWTWTGSSTNSWTAAKAVSETATVEAASSVAAPTMQTAGWITTNWGPQGESNPPVLYTNYYARRLVRRQKFILSDLNTDVPRTSIDTYLFALSPYAATNAFAQEKVYAHGWGTWHGLHAQSETFSIGQDGGLTSGVWIGGTALEDPPAWCDDPTLSGTRATNYGWAGQAIQAVVKWSDYLQYE